MKTLKEFDYDLWAIEENGRKRYFARIKATGEETEVSLEVMRLLLSQEKQMLRGAHDRTHRRILQNADGQPAFDLYGMPHRGEKPVRICCGARHDQAKRA